MSEIFKKMDYQSVHLHSFMRASQRIANLSMFRAGKARILVTTDLTARGLDISHVHLVINFSIPQKVSDYIHRVGRTARNGYEGDAISFLTPN